MSNFNTAVFSSTQDTVPTGYSFVPDTTYEYTSITRPQTFIGNNSFSSNSFLTNFTIADTVTSIGNYAFNNSSNLSTVTIGNSVNSIGNYAFNSCRNLSTVTIGNSVTSMGESAFESCSKLITVTIGNSVTSIGKRAFRNCTNLSTITIPNSVTSMGESAFESCSKLITVTIGNSVTSISGGAFRYCRNLSTVTIGNSVTTISNYAFYDCNNLTNFSVDSSNNNYSSDSNGVLFNKSQTNLIQYPNGNTNTSYTIPNSVTTIGDFAFDTCSNLSTVTIGNSVTSISGGAFRYCRNLSTVTIGNSVTTISNTAFYDCNNLSTITIGNSVNIIGNNAFASNAFSTITIPNSVTTIDAGAFSSCRNLSRINIPNSVNTIGGYAFYYCFALTSITFNSSVLPILGDNSFFNNPAINSRAYVPSSTSEQNAENLRTLTRVGIQNVSFVEPPPPPPCFLIGSKILTDKGYKLVEDLRKGDLVKTLKNDYLPIVLIGKSPIYNSGDFTRIKNRLYTLSKDKYSDLTEDLVLTGCHSILVDELTKEQEEATIANYGAYPITDGKVRLETYLDDKAEPYPEQGTFTIYHLALENENYFSNYGIWANGLLVESCSKRYLLELSGMELIE